MTALTLLQESPFFEIFSEEDLGFLASSCERVSFQSGEMILVQDQPAEAFFMLVQGKVQLSFDESGPPGFSRSSSSTTEQKVFVRTIEESGRPLGWSSMVEPFHYRANARAISDVELLAWRNEDLQRYCLQNPKFGMVFMERILWVLGNRLRATRIRLVTRRFEKEVLAIRALLDNEAESLSVSSPLHKIPHYLENRLTLSDAFDTLELLKTQGKEGERNLAGLCLDILENVRLEMKLFQKQQGIYECVAEAPPDKKAEDLRAECCEKFIDMFSHVKSVVRGIEHLPEGGGHIFVMNHLVNHPDNILPNDFQLTLDTHFVSSVILYKRYGQAPIRVIRKSRSDEFGHQMYYDRLGYIYVAGEHVDGTRAAKTETKENRRQTFLERAQEELLAGQNLVICPEGTSTETDDSPRPFKAGAFRLAAFVKPEPLIVPVAVANFDKKLTQTTVVVVVRKPFKLSTFVSPGAPEEEFYRFVNNYNEQFRNYVKEAIFLADHPPVPKHP